MHIVLNIWDGRHVKKVSSILFYFLNFWQTCPSLPFQRKSKRTASSKKSVTRTLDFTSHAEVTSSLEVMLDQRIADYDPDLPRYCLSLFQKHARFPHPKIRPRISHDVILHELYSWLQNRTT